MRLAPMMAAPVRAVNAQARHAADSHSQVRRGEDQDGGQQARLFRTLHEHESGQRRTQQKPEGQGRSGSQRVVEGDESRALGRHFQRTGWPGDTASTAAASGKLPVVFRSAATTGSRI